MNDRCNWRRVFLLAVLAPLTILAQRPGFNYDESKVGSYVLPNPLISQNGSSVKSASQWRSERRPEILELFRSQVFGRVPAGLPSPRFTLVETDKQALNGAATRKQVAILLAGTNGGPVMNLLLYVPNDRKGPAPAFLSLNFGGNHTTISDPAVFVTTNWVGSKYGKDNKATGEQRGRSASRWPIQKLIESGFAVATVYYGDIEPDHAQGWSKGVRGFFAAGKERQPDDWCAISAWAWGLSRALDYLEKDGDVNATQVAVVGHSRLGKTALWAGAQDERFAGVISNNSGEGGASLARRYFGETTKRINTSFPHWFCANYKKYNDNEASLPVDAHMLIGLSAPRPVYVASAQEDLWSDPKGEFLALKAAEPIYKLLGVKGLAVTEMPAVNKPVIGRLGYHIRSGVHDIRDFDWDQYIQFARQNFRK